MKVLPITITKALPDGTERIAESTAVTIESREDLEVLFAAMDRGAAAPNEQEVI